MIATAKLFKNGRSQAVRLPKEFRFEGTEVLIEKVGDTVILTPKKKKWESLLAALKMEGADFERNQPPTQKRDWGELWK
jgi:antitoxin VapB